MVIFMIFASAHYPSRMKGYSELLLCEAPKGEGSLNADSKPAEAGWTNWKPEKAATSL